MDQHNRIFLDNKYCKLPDEYLREVSVGESRIVRFDYETKDHISNDKTYTKYALVYLPDGYNEKDDGIRYNVLYLMHGGGCTPEWYLGGEDQQSKLKNMLDQMIRDGLIEHLICSMLSVS